MLLLLLLFSAYFTSATIHRHMTKDELQMVFNTFGSVKIPKYEVVSIEELKINSDAQVSKPAAAIEFKAFGENHTIKLEETTGYLFGKDTPIWTVQSDPEDFDSPIYIKNNDIFDNFTTYQDEKTLAAVIKFTDKQNNTFFDGTFKSEYVIRSLPQRILQESSSNHRIRRALKCHDGLNCNLQHLVIKKPLAALNESHVPFKFMDETPSELEQPREPPAIVYPEILVLVDRSHYTSLGSNLKRALRYVIAFWNAIDLRYRLLTAPNVRLNIAGVVIALDEYALPYIGNNTFKLKSEETQDDTAYLDADKGLLNKSKYLYREALFSEGSFDVAMTLTSLDLCNIEVGDFCDPTTVGYAFVGGACTHFHNNETVEAVGIVEDSGGFDGIMPTTHELGHLLGVNHDGYLTSSSCDAGDGYIMAPAVMLSENGFEWSSCSKKAFNEFFSTQLSSCMDNEPPAMEKLGLVLPGKMMSLDEQCRSVYGQDSYACDKNSEMVCHLLNCYTQDIWWGGGYCTQKSAAAEGSPCGDNKHCINGKCVDESIEPTKVR